MLAVIPLPDPSESFNAKNQGSERKKGEEEENNRATSPRWKSKGKERKGKVYLHIPRKSAQNILFLLFISYSHISHMH